MARRRTQPPSPFWKRVEAVMKVQRGEATVEGILAELGLSRMQYYRLEEAMLRAALEAVTPKKRGRKPKIADEKTRQLEERLTDVQRDRELLEVRTRELERVNAEMRRRAIGAAGGKKRARPAAEARMAVPKRVSADGAGPATGA